MPPRAHSLARGLAALGVCAACASPPRKESAAAPYRIEATAEDLSGASCVRATTAPALTPVGREGSRLALARGARGLYAYVGDPDTRTLQVIDVDGARLLGAILTPGKPEQVLVLRDGRVVATLTDRDEIAVFEPVEEPEAGLRLLCTRRVAGGPFGIAASADGARIAVTSTWSGALTALSSADLRIESARPTARAPAGVTVLPDGRAFVSHVVGSALSVADLGDVDAPVRAIDLPLRAGFHAGDAPDSRNARFGAQGYALVGVTLGPDTRAPELPAAVLRGAAPRGVRPAEGRRRAPERAPREAAPSRVVAPMVSVEPGDVARPSEVYYGPPRLPGLPPHAPLAVVVDARGERALSGGLLAALPEASSGRCFLPRAIVERPVAARLYLACVGSDRILELDAQALDPMRAVTARLEAPRGPVGLALAEEEGILAAVGEFSRSVRLYRLDGGRGAEVELSSPRDERSAALERGRELFHRTDDVRISSTGFACASCHPAGRSDGLTWATPEGPRNTLMLAGRLHGTAPYGWSRDRRTLDEYVLDTTRRLGEGLDQADAAAVAAYVSSLEGPRAPPMSAAARRGATIFAERGCVTCHAGPMTTDGERHRITSPTGDWIDTPSLRHVGLTAPYFHDGRFSTLDALLRDPAAAMGGELDLDEEDRGDLRAYLEAL